MRTLFKFLTLCGGLALVFPAGAVEPAACPGGGAKVLVTGSAIKRCARLVGAYTLDTPSPVMVIGRTDIDHSGYSTTIDLLRHQVPASH